MDFSTSPFRHERFDTDVCVVGGGMSGLCAAVAASRRGARVVLMHERPVFGGNVSSEIGVRICGADRNAKIPHLRETGILEEIRLKNLWRNPQANYSLWDLVLFDTVRFAPNLISLLNCSCLDAAMDGKRLAAVTGWQQTTQTWCTVSAKIFIDCSGDSILAPLTGAPHRMGREGRDEYGESFAPEAGDELTMGMSCGWLGEDAGEDRPWKPLHWTRKFESCDDFPWGADNHSYLVWAPWWCELGGEHHSIHDTETLRDEILRINLGLWEHIKTDCVHSEKAKTWDLHKVPFLPGKRESRRYIGAHVLSQSEVEAEGPFDDVIGHGGWTMDDHHPGGFWSFTKYGQPPTIHHPAPSPYGIPLRCLYSNDVPNLMFAGRNASCTHIAMSSTRVSGTCSVMGQAAGTAAAMAVARGVDPAGVPARIVELQQQLLVDDVYLPRLKQAMPEIMTRAQLEAVGDPEPVRDGINRQVGEDPHCWHATPGEALTVYLPAAAEIDEVMLVLDSAMEAQITLDGPGLKKTLPTAMPKSLRVDVLAGEYWETVWRDDDNWQRLVFSPVKKRAQAVRLTIEATRGADLSRVYACVVNPLRRPAAPAG